MGKPTLNDANKRGESWEEARWTENSVTGVTGKVSVSPFRQRQKEQERSDSCGQLRARALQAEGTAEPGGRAELGARKRKVSQQGGQSEGRGEVGGPCQPRSHRAHGK